MAASTTTDRGLAPVGAALLVAAVAGAIALHAAAGHGFPVPWPDEVDFLTPAAELARHGSLNVPQLGAAHGMFWMSDLYAFLLAPVFRVAPTTLDTARFVSLAATVVAAAGFWSAARRFGINAVAAAAAVTLWLVSPRVVLAGNIARQEALLLAFLAWALAATAGRRRVLALALAGFTALIHPAGIAFAVVLVAANVAPVTSSTDRATRRWEWAVLVVLAAIVLFEAAHFAAHASVAIDQLRFQAARKTHRNATFPRPLVGAAIVAASAVVFRFRDAAVWPALVFGAIGLTCVAIFEVGGEMWYKVYAYETAALCVGLALFAVMTRFGTDARRRVAAVGIGALAVFIFGFGGFGRPFYGMQFRQHSHEWDAFVVDVRAQLARVPSSPLGAPTVAINAQSGLPWPVETDRIGHVRIVKETAVTARPAGANYLLIARTICCFIRGAAPRGDVVARVRSDHNTFDATLLRLTPVAAR